MMFGLGWIGMLFMFLFWLLLIGAAVWLIWAIFGRRGHVPMSTSGHYWGSSTNARQILDERYAKGEITREQYEQMKQDIA